MGDTENGLTRTGSIVGSPQYMAPEQAQGLRTIDARADIWALGIVLYRLLAGENPHEGETFGQIILSICSRPLPRIDRVAPWVERELADVVFKATRIDPAERYASCEEL